MSFTWFPEQTAIIYLYSISLLVFIAETGRVYCSARTEPLTTTATQVNLSNQKAKIFLNFEVANASCSCSPRELNSQTLTPLV